MTPQPQPVSRIDALAEAAQKVLAGITPSGRAHGGAGLCEVCADEDRFSSLADPKTVLALIEALRECGDAVNIKDANDASSRNAFDVHASIAFSRVRAAFEKVEALR